MQVDFHLQIYTSSVLFSLFLLLNRLRDGEDVINLALVISLTTHLMNLVSFSEFSPVYRIYTFFYVMTTIIVVGNREMNTIVIHENKLCLLNLEIVRMCHRIYLLFENLELTYVSGAFSILTIFTLSKFGVIAFFSVIRKTFLEAVKSEEFYFLGILLCCLLSIHLRWLYGAIKVFITTLYHTFVFPVYKQRPKVNMFY